MRERGCFSTTTLAQPQAIVPARLPGSAAAENIAYRRMPVWGGTGRDDGIANRHSVLRMSEMGVRRDKAALSSGCKSHPAIAPAGSSRSSYGGNELAEAFGMRVTNW